MTTRGKQTYSMEAPLALRQLSGVRIEALPHRSLPRGGPGRDIYGNFVVTDLTVEVNEGKGWHSVAFQRKLADDGKVNDAKTKQLWKVDASREDNRLARQFVVLFEPALKVAPAAQIRIRLRQDSDLVGQSIGRFRVSVSAAEDPSWIVQVSAKQRPTLESTTRDAAASKALAEFFRSVAPSLRRRPRRIEAVEEGSRKVKDHNGARARRTTRRRAAVSISCVHAALFQPKRIVSMPDVPAALGSLPAGQAVNRLTLAKWLVSRDNPLTARVAVNRIWEQYFGRGLVETSEDFGTQGQRPTHPELLDWLAVEFMDGGWKMKAIHRLIVTSAAYRQTSAVSPELLKADPDNRLLSRGPRFRLEAEMIRDVALSASGLLVRKVGGPSVFPPQPPGIWDLPYNDDKWEESKGPDRYRRGIYTFIRRSAPYPAMVNFDAPSRESCTIRRTRTNTPLQALTTLNDVAFFEAAQALGARLMKEGGATDRARIDYGFRLTTARPAKPAELDRILTWEGTERAYFKAHPDEAKRIARYAGKPAEQAVWIMLANVLLNADESLTNE